MLMSVYANRLEGYGAYEIIMMLHRLHQRGYEQLRILPGMSPSSLYWRWFIYPKVLMKNDARLERGMDFVQFDCPCGSTGSAKTGIRVSELADTFTILFPDIVKMGEGKDPEYVKWFMRLVRHAMNNCFPIAFADGPVGKEWAWTASKRSLPFPPFTPSEAL